MAIIAWSLKEHPAIAVPRERARGGLLEWRVLVVSFTLFLYSFGYGGITSFTALYADANRVTPKGIYLTTLAVVILVTRPLAGRLGDRWGYKRVFLPCLVLITAGLACLAFGGTRSLADHVGDPVRPGLRDRVPGVRRLRDAATSAPTRRGAAFGAILAAFDTGIGTGSTSMGWLIQHYGFASAFGVAAALSALALPYFLFDGPGAANDGPSRLAVISLSPLSRSNDSESLNRILDVTSRVSEPDLHPHIDLPRRHRRRRLAEERRGHHAGVAHRVHAVEQVRRRDEQLEPDPLVLRAAAADARRAGRRRRRRRRRAA